MITSLLTQADPVISFSTNVHTINTNYLKMLLATDLCIQERLAKSAASIALHNFHWQYTTLVLFNSTIICSVDIFLKSYDKNLIVGQGMFYPRFVKGTTQYVIFGADLLDIVDMLTWMQRHQFDNTGTYIVVCQTEQWNNCNEVDIIKILWTYKIINVVVINSLKDKMINGFTYYYPEDCVNTRPTDIKNWDSCLLNGNRFCQNMYPLKMKNLHRCPIIVSTFNQVPYMNISGDTPTGADGDLLCVIAKALNLSLVMMTPRIGTGWGRFEDNGTWTGSLADVYNGWANFSMTSASITLTRFTTFQISTYYSVVTVAWITHPSELQPSSLKLLHPFQVNARIALGVSFAMVVLFKLFLRSGYASSLGQTLNITFPEGIVFHSWEMCMGLPVSCFPSNKALLSLVVFWIWYCFLIRTLYQVCLINSLQTDVYAPEFETIEKAIASKYSYGGGLALRDYFVDYPQIYNEWKDVGSVEYYPTVVKLTQGLKFVLAMNIETTKMFLSSNPDKKLRKLPRIIITSPTGLFFKKYSPLVSSLNVVLSRLRESGISQKIYMNNTGKKNLKSALDTKTPISLVHYTGCYTILLIGWVLSTVCFVVEKIIASHSAKKNRKCNKYINDKP